MTLKLIAYATFKKEMRGMNYDSAYVFTVRINSQDLTLMIQPLNDKAIELFRLFGINTSTQFSITSEIVIDGSKKYFTGTAKPMHFTSRDSNFLFIERESDGAQFIIAAATQSAITFRNIFISARNAPIEIIITI